MIRTLIVEDDPMVMEFNKQYLKQVEGFSLEGEASTIREAKNIISNKDFDLILLDVYLMEGNGFSLLEYIRKNQIDVEVILITAAKDVKSVEKAMRYGVVDYLIKPFQFERFNKALTSYRERTKIFVNKKVINQQELDEVFFKRENSHNKKNLPKGLTKVTLQMLKNEMLLMNDKLFSTEEIALRIGVSRVSIRKYLSFLEDIGVVKIEVEYGCIGRPITKYQYDKRNENILNQFLL